jgi:hypothetical protein
MTEVLSYNNDITTTFFHVGLGYRLGSGSLQLSPSLGVDLISRVYDDGFDDGFDNSIDIALSPSLCLEYFLSQNFAVGILARTPIVIAGDSDSTFELGIGLVVGMYL